MSHKNVSPFSSTFGLHTNVSFFSSTFESRINVSSFSSVFGQYKKRLFLHGKNGLNIGGIARHTTEKVSYPVTKSFVAAEKRRIILLFLRAIPRKMLQFSTLETTSTGEKVVNLGKRWSTAALVRRTSWLIPPPSVGAIMQLQPDLLVVFGAFAFATIFCLGTHLCQNPSCLYDDPSQTPLCLSGDFPEYKSNSGSSNVWSSGMSGHVNPFTIVVFKLVVLIFVPTIFSVVVIVQVVALSHIGAVSPIIVEGRVR